MGHLNFKNGIIAMIVLIVVSVGYDMLTYTAPAAPKTDPTSAPASEEVNDEYNQREPAYVPPPAPAKDTPATPEQIKKKAARWHNIALKLFNGRQGREKDIEAAFGYIEKAAATGSYRSMWIIVHCHLYGYGTVANKDTAKEYMEKAIASADEENKVAMEKYFKTLDFEVDVSDMTQEEKETVLPFDTGKGDIQQKAAAAKAAAEAEAEEASGEDGDNDMDYDDEGSDEGATDKKEL